MTADARALPLTLTHRASRNAVASLLDYSAHLGTSLVVTPFLVRGLGPALFGSWEMLLRLGSYVSATDGRPTDALRLVVSHTQGTAGADERRRMVGAAIAVWAVLFPVVATLGTLLVVYAPTLMSVTPAQAADARLAAALVVTTLLVASLGAIPESVLRGLNLGYTRLGVQAALHVTGGALAVAAIWRGFGLAGLGGAALIAALLTSLAFLAIVRRRVPWFGARAPTRADVRRLLAMSVWLTAGDLVAKLVLASDVVILGLVNSTASVTAYVLTGYAARAAIGVHVFTAGEAMPGIGGLIGESSFARARRARQELLLMTWLYATVAGTTILLWNRSFLDLWVGPDAYAGAAVDGLIVLAATQTAFIRVDSGLIDAGLRPRLRVMVGLVAAVVTITLATLGTHYWGTMGLGFGLLAGRGVQSLAYPLLARRTLGLGALPAPTEARVLDERRRERRTAAWTLLRAATVTGLLFALALAGGARLTLSTWLAFAVGVVITVALVAVIALALGATAPARAALHARLRSLAPRGGAA